MQEIARLTFKSLDCTGLARVDFFLTADGFFVNEINTMPGFTPISMFPSLWQASGLAYADLIDELIQLALER
jgi:D-alanine-D-alanine ligase